MIQIPNKHFLMDVHTGLPSFIPKGLRYPIKQVMGVDVYDPPELKDVLNAFLEICPRVNMKVIKAAYDTPSNMNPLTALYRLALRIGVFRLSPPSYLIISLPVRLLEKTKNS